MILTAKEILIANEIYTYLKNAEQGEEQLEDKLDQIKQGILGKKSAQTCNKIKTYANTPALPNIDERKNNKDYTLLMLAASNGLPNVVSLLLSEGADKNKIIEVNGKLFSMVLRNKIKNEEITQQEVIELKKKKRIEITALQIAQVKKYMNIINLLK